MSLLRSKRPTPKNTKFFMKLLDEHERSWGRESYTGRPSIEQILNAKVVAFWFPSGVDEDWHMTVTLHDNLRDISKYITALVQHSKERIPLVRLAHVFKNKEEIKIKSVEVIFEPPK